jgi:sugar lactone lactonase YvrE
MIRSLTSLLFSIILLLVISTTGSAQNSWIEGQTPEDILFSVSGFDGPEAVRYDADLDIYFVSCFNGNTSGDANGYISKVSGDGEIIELKFMIGTADFPFDAGRGMFITGDTLWVADHLGVHYFDKNSGEHLGFVDFSSENPGFLNDIAADNQGRLYVTDTGVRKVYRFNSSGYQTVIEDLPIMPNGITLLPNGNLALAPWREGPNIYQINPETGELLVFGTVNGSDNYDGIEFFDGALITSTQQDSSLHIMINGQDELFIKVSGRPADIAINPNENVVAVPYVALGKVDFWKLKQ